MFGFLAKLPGLLGSGIKAIPGQMQKMGKMDKGDDTDDMADEASPQNGGWTGRAKQLLAGLGNAYQRQNQPQPAIQPQMASQIQSYNPQMADLRIQSPRERMARFSPYNY
jgi:hypothetical protein